MFSVSIFCFNYKFITFVVGSDEPNWLYSILHYINVLYCFCGLAQQLWFFVVVVLY